MDIAKEWNIPEDRSLSRGAPAFVSRTLTFFFRGWREPWRRLAMGLCLVDGGFTLAGGAERMVHNVGVYDTRRSSEDGSVNLVAIHPADIPSAGPQEQSIDNEVRPTPLVVHEGPPNQPEGNTRLSSASYPTTTLSSFPPLLSSIYPTTPLLLLHTAPNFPSPPLHVFRPLLSTCHPSTTLSVFLPLPHTCHSAPNLFPFRGMCKFVFPLSFLMYCI